MPKAAAARSSDDIDTTTAGGCFALWFLRNSKRASSAKEGQTITAAYSGSGEGPGVHQSLALFIYSTIKYVHFHAFNLSEDGAWHQKY